MAILFGALFTACSNDDDGGSNGTSVEGNWRLTAFTTENNYDINEDGTATNDFMMETNCYSNETITFNSNNTGTVTSRSFADITLELVSGSTTDYEYSVDCVQETDNTTIVWAQSENIVTLTGPGIVYEGLISGSTLTFVIEEGVFIEVEDGSGTATTTEDITFVYTKQ